MRLVAHPFVVTDEIAAAVIVVLAAVSLLGAGAGRLAAELLRGADAIAAELVINRAADERFVAAASQSPFEPPAFPGMMRKNRVSRGS